MTTINAYSATLAGTTNAYASSTAQSTTSAATDKTADSTATASTDTVTLSDTAKAYLAAAPADAATLAANARTWFDQQYKDNNISSPLIKGEVAVDFSDQSRATLSAIASNSQALFSKDETVAAAKALSDRFDTAMTPHVVIARAVGDYASLYQAADKYLDQAGADERATPLWQSQKDAVTAGLAAAKLATTKAPVTSGNDPVGALLTKTTQVAAAADSTDTAALSTKARAMLDAQANAARDAGTSLVFDKKRTTGQQADFSQFDNQQLALVTLNSDGSFSAEESRAAKTELTTRNRTSILAAFNSKTNTDVQSQSLALLSHYSGMSAAEKAAMGYTDALQSRLISNYRTASMFSSGGFLGASSTSSSSSSGTGTLASYL